MSMSSPLMEITMEGDVMTIKNSSLLRTVEFKFKFGEEYDETMPNTVIKVSKTGTYLDYYDVLRKTIET